jgi:acyl carrier protein
LNIIGKNLAVANPIDMPYLKDSCHGDFQMSTKETLRDFILSELVQPGHGNGLEDTESLIESGLIDSMGIMALLTFIEETFSFQVSLEDLTPENFETIETISCLIKKQRS